MSNAQSAKIIGLGSVDPIFTQIRTEAEEIVRREPEVAGFVLGAVLNQSHLAGAIIQRLADRLDKQELPGDLIRHAYLDMAARDPPSSTLSAPISLQWRIVIPPARGSSSRCFTSRASTRSRRTASRMRCGRRDARTLPFICRVARLKCFSATFTPPQ